MLPNKSKNSKIISVGFLDHLPTNVSTSYNPARDQIEGGAIRRKEERGLIGQASYLHILADQPMVVEVDVEEAGAGWRRRWPNRRRLSPDLL